MTLIIGDESRSFALVPEGETWATLKKISEAKNDKEVRGVRFTLDSLKGEQ